MQNQISNDNYKQFKETFKEGFNPGAIEITSI